MKRRLAALALTLCATLSPTDGAASGTQDPWAARVAEAALVAQQAKGVPARLRALTDLIAAQEAGQAVFRDRLRELESREEAARADLAARDTQLAGLLLSLQRTDQGAAPLPMLHPQGAVAAARAAGLSDALITGLTVQRQALAEDMRDVQALRADLAAAAQDLAVLQRETASARQQLIAAAAAKGALPPAHDSEAAAARALALGARSIAGLTQQLSTGSVSSAATPRNLPLPVAARPVVRGDGWALQAGAGALVRAPAAGSLLYVGPLRGSRIVVLLEISPGQILVLAGVGQALYRTGDQVAAGAALGFLPESPGTSAAPASQRIVQNSAFPAGSLPPDTLYMELRVADRPVDPAQWFAATEDR